MRRLLGLVCVLAACASNDDEANLVPYVDAEADMNGLDISFDRDGGDEVGGADVADAEHDGGGPNSMLCRPNSDGSIEAAEVPLGAGLSAKFRVAHDAAWDTSGEDVDGELTWDLAQEFDGEADVLVELRDLSGQWFETTFPDGDYFVGLSTKSDTLGVFRITADEVQLLGVVSPEDGLTRTELEYDPPVPILRFPLQAGERWSVESTVSGVFSGVASLYTETYVFEVDAAGRLLTPFSSDFEVLRVRSVLDREVGLLTTVIRSFAFIAECFGTVATVDAMENDPGPEFADTSELRRLAP